MRSAFAWAGVAVGCADGGPAPPVAVPGVGWGGAPGGRGRGEDGAKRAPGAANGALSGARYWRSCAS